jgi:hypothetical protein
VLQNGRGRWGRQGPLGRLVTAPGMPAAPESLDFGCGALPPVFPEPLQLLSRSFAQEDVFPAVSPVLVVGALAQVLVVPLLFDQPAVAVEDDFAIVHRFFVESGIGGKKLIFLVADYLGPVYETFYGRNLCIFVIR